VFTLPSRRAGVTQSMGRTGSALDNAVSEAFNSTLELELLRDQALHHPRRGAPCGGELDRRVQHGPAPFDGRDALRLTVDTSAVEAA
jgi:hypothetical protein